MNDYRNLRACAAPRVPGVLMCGNGGSPFDNALRAEASDALAEIERLRAIVARLPMTRDGAIITLGMRVWTTNDCDPDEDFEGWIVLNIGPEYPAENMRYDWVNTNGNGYLTTSILYSTRAAAESALRGDSRAPTPRGELL